MTELLTANQMRAIEHAAIKAGRVSGLELMERAGNQVVKATFDEWPELASGHHHAVVLCGPGNNGGDGFVIARLLAQSGWTVDVFFYGDAQKLSPDARSNFDRWTRIGSVKKLTDRTLDATGFPEPCDLVIDALFGTGLTRPIGVQLGTVASRQVCSRSFKTVAVDIPSGLCSDSGRRIGSDAQGITADLTIAFHRAKLGHVLASGPLVCGKYIVADIGL